MRVPAWVGTAGQVALAAALPFFIITSAVLFVTNFLPFYQMEYASWRTGDATGLTEAELLRATREILAYFWGQHEPLAIEVNLGGLRTSLFNEREVAHMADVKLLFRGVQALQIASFIAAAGISVTALWRMKRAGRRYLAPALMWGGGITLGIVVLAALGSLLDFNRLFVQFHLMSFSNDFWMLDPRRDRLVMMFPLGFWLHATIFVALLTAAAGLAAFAAGWTMMGAPVRPAAAAARDAARQQEGL